MSQSVQRWPDARPWLFGIATNLIGRRRRGEVRFLRAIARTGIDPAAGSAEPVADQVTDRVAAQAARKELAAALAALATADRDVLLLTDYAGRTGTAVAWSNDSYLFELIFNPSTYQFMGQQEVAEPGNRAGTPAGQVVWGMALLAAYVTDTAPAVSRSTEFYPILWQDFAPGVPNTN